jgi:hypothetical protein
VDKGESELGFSFIFSTSCRPCPYDVFSFYPPPSSPAPEPQPGNRSACQPPTALGKVGSLCPPALPEAAL